MMSGQNIKGNKFDYQVLKRLFSFIKPYKWFFILLIVTTILASLLAPIIPILIKKLIGDHLEKRDYEGMLTIFIWMLVVLFIQAIFFFVNTYLSGWLGQSIIRDIRVQLYRHILYLKVQFFDRTPIGQLVTRCISDIETLAEVFSQGLAALVGEILQVIVILVVMFALNWRLTLITLSVFPLLLFATYIFKEKIKASYDEVRTAVAKLNTFVQEHVTGMSIVQIFNAEEREYGYFKDINHGHRKANLKSVKYYSIYFPIAEVLGAIGIGLIVWYGGQGILSDVHWVAGPEDLIVFIMFLNMFFRPIRTIADRFNTLQMGIISTERIMRLLDSDAHIADEGSTEVDVLRGEISFENVWFAYKPDEYILKDVSFKVSAGESLAIVGATGAGKSSIINLLNRYYEFDKGELRIDTLDIRSFKLQNLRKHIGIVLQDVFLFSNSIRENITLGDTSISDDKIWEAIHMIGAEKFINQLPGQLDYNVQERGNSLSSGQRQLTSFIRVLVYNPQILVLDEATSSVDSETEQLIQVAIDKLMKGRTSIVIAHRLSTIQKADKIMVLDKGEVKEIGSHDSLLSQQGAYYQLHQMQLSHAK